jgi:hypothetical protein
VPRLEEAAALAGELGARGLACGALVDLASALLSRLAPGDLARAERQAEAAAALAAEVRPGREAVARARLARALLHAGDARAALVPSAHALLLLDRLGHAEGGEEEILWTRFLVLGELGDRDAAAALARARASLAGKLGRIDDPAWRASFADLELNRRIAAGA